MRAIRRDAVARQHMTVDRPWKPAAGALNGRQRRSRLGARLLGGARFVPRQPQAEAAGPERVAAPAWPSEQAAAAARIAAALAAGQRRMAAGLMMAARPWRAAAALPARSAVAARRRCAVSADRRAG